MVSRKDPGVSDLLAGDQRLATSPAHPAGASNTILTSVIW